MTDPIPPAGQPDETPPPDEEQAGEGTQPGPEPEDGPEQRSEQVTPVGKRTTTRTVRSRTTRSDEETSSTTEETIVEDMPLVPPVYAAPDGGHPRPVG